MIKYFEARVPCRTRQEAREIVRLRATLTDPKARRKLVAKIARYMWRASDEAYEGRSTVEAVLQALHLIP